MSTKTLAAAIAGAIQAIENCRNNNDTAERQAITAEWLPRHKERAEKLTRDHMPRGSGVDNGTHIDLGRSTPECLVFYTAFHHMDDCGYYDGWTEHTVRVRASLFSGLRITISGPDRNDVKDYLWEVFDCALRAEVEEFPQ